MAIPAPKRKPEDACGHSQTAVFRLKPWLARPPKNRRERIGDESKTQSDSAFVHGYILMRLAWLTRHPESILGFCAKHGRTHDNQRNSERIERVNALIWLIFYPPNKARSSLFSSAI